VSDLHPSRAEVISALWGAYWAVASYAADNPEILPEAAYAAFDVDLDDVIRRFKTAVPL